MRHLTPVELVDLVEGTLAGPRADHGSSCERCRRQADDLRAALAAAGRLDAPEPSPLFWDHFSARVREAVAAEASPRPAWGFRWRPAWYAALTAIALLSVVIAARWPPSPGPTTPAPAVAAGEPSGGEWLAAVEGAPDDRSWSLITAAAGVVTWDEASGAGLSPRSGTVDREVFLLTAEERSELVRLLRAEMPRGES